MKKLIMLLTACLFAVTAMAQDKKSNPKNPQSDEKSKPLYCALMKDDGTMGITTEGKDLVTNVTLPNGTVLKTDGTVIKRDGVPMMMKDGDCIDINGMVVKTKEEKMEKSDSYK